MILSLALPLALAASNPAASLVPVVLTQKVEIIRSGGKKKAVTTETALQIAPDPAAAERAAATDAKVEELKQQLAAVKAKSEAQEAQSAEGQKVKAEQAKAIEKYGHQNVETWQNAANALGGQ